MIELEEKSLTLIEKIELDELKPDIAQRKIDVKNKEMRTFKEELTAIVNQLIKITDREYIKKKIIKAVADDRSTVRLKIIEYDSDDINMDTVLVTPICYLNINHNELSKKDIDQNLSIKEMITNIIPIEYKVYGSPLTKNETRRYKVYIESGIHCNHPCSIFCCCNVTYFHYFCWPSIEDPFCCCCYLK